MQVLHWTKTERLTKDKDAAQWLKNFPNVCRIEILFSPWKEEKADQTKVWQRYGET